MVRLLDTPDELRGAEIGFLDQGDEVQLLEKRGVYWLVLCPDGRQGWIHKMTLGDVVGEPPARSSPTATMPIAAETWTMGDDVDGDVLTAYLESRRRPDPVPDRAGARGCAGGRCSGRRPADSRTAAAASRPGAR